MKRLESSVKAPDRQAQFEELYAQYADDVLRMAYFYLADKQKAEDVCQDVFVKLYTRGEAIAPGCEKAWLLRVTVNCCRDLWRSAWLKRVVLGAPTTKDRFQDATRLLDYGYANYQLLRPELPELPMLPVRRGVVPEVALTVKDGAFSVLAEKSGEQEIECQLSLAEAVTAPVEPGQTVGTVTYVRAGETIGESPVVTAEGVDRAGFVEIFFEVLSGVMPS